jgi:hypothetical protein
MKDIFNAILESGYTYWERNFEGNFFGSMRPALVFIERHLSSKKCPRRIARADFYEKISF